MALTKKQQAFVEFYLRDWNGSKAARLAGYSERSAARIAYELLDKPEIQDAIRARLEEIKMTSDEVLMRLSEQARLDVSDFIQPGGAIDWKAVKERGHLVKKISHNAGMNSTIELHDAQAALKLLGTAHRLFNEKSELDVSLSVVGLEQLLDKVYGKDKD